MTTATYKPRFKILNREEILAEPDVEWLIEGIFPQDGLLELYGEPGTYKSFVALAAGCSVATGKPFLDTFAVKRSGDVVYICAEGSRGIGKRLLAWEDYYNDGAQASKFYAIGEPVDMLSTEPERVIADITAAAIAPVLIVVDTLARCFVSGDENNTKDMSAFVRGCDKLKCAFPGCSVLVVHHCGWDPKRPRGNRALEGATETIWSCIRKDNFAFLQNRRQKDFTIHDEKIALKIFDVPGTESAVLRMADPAMVKAVDRSNDNKALEALRAAGDAGLTNAEWEARTGINKHTLKDVRKRLEQRKFARSAGGGRRWFAERMVTKDDLARPFEAAA